MNLLTLLQQHPYIEQHIVFALLSEAKSFASLGSACTWLYQQLLVQPYHLYLLGMRPLDMAACITHDADDKAEFDRVEAEHCMLQRERFTGRLQGRTVIRPIKLSMRRAAEVAVGHTSEPVVGQLVRVKADDSIRVIPYKPIFDICI